MHSMGRFVPRKRFRRNKIMMIKFHKDETSHLVLARTMYFHPSRSGIWADGNFSLVAKEESNKKKTPRKKTEVPCESGDRRSRTDDPLLAKQML